MRLPSRTALLLCLGYIGVATLVLSYNAFMPLHLEGLGLSATLVGFVMTWDNYLSMGLSPVVGLWSDRKRTRLGRRRPWMLVGAPLVGLGMASLPLLSEVWLLLGVLLVANLCLVLVRVPMGALTADLFPSSERGVVSGTIMLAAAIGGLIAFVGGGLLRKLHPALPLVVGGVLYVVGILTVVARVREPLEPASPAELHESPWQVLRRLLRLLGTRRMGGAVVALMLSGVVTASVEAWVSSFSVHALGVSADKAPMLIAAGAVVTLVCVLPCAAVGDRLGRDRALLLGLVLYMAVFTGAFFVRGPVGLAVVLACMGVGYSLLSVNGSPYLYDLDDTQSPGALGGVLSMTGGLSLVIGPPLVGLLIDLTGKNYYMLFAVCLGASVLGAASLLWSMTRPREQAEVPAQPLSAKGTGG